MIDMASVPRMENIHIDAEAFKLLAAFAHQRGVAEVAPPIPIDEIIENHLKVQIDFEDLGWLGQGVLGATWMEGDGRIAIHTDLETDAHEGRLCFTMAHEVGHWRLHRPMFLFEKSQQPLFKRENNRPSIYCRDVGRSAPKKTRGEYQADRFAGGLLMPRKFVDAAWRESVGAKPLSLAAGARHVNLRSFSEDEYARTLAETVREAGRFSNVSVAAMVVRLKELGWLVSGNIAGAQGVLGL